MTVSTHRSRPYPPPPGSRRPPLPTGAHRCDALRTPPPARPRTDRHRARRHSGVALSALTTILLAAGCTGPPTPEPTRPGSRPPATTGHPTSTPPSRTPGSDDDADIDGVEPTAAALAAIAALDAAARFIHAWARPNVAPDAWYAAIRPLVTDTYADHLTTVDPTRVPAHTITGPITPVIATRTAVTADAPTNAGPIRLTLVLIDHRWLITDVQPAGPPR